METLDSIIAGALTTPSFIRNLLSQTTPAVPGHSHRVEADEVVQMYLMLNSAEMTLERAGGDELIGFRSFL